MSDLPSALLQLWNNLTPVGKYLSSRRIKRENIMTNISGKQPFGLQFAEEIEHGNKATIIESFVYDQERDVSLIKREGEFVPFVLSASPSISTTTVTQIVEEPEDPSPDEHIARSVVLTTTGTAETPDPPEDPEPGENMVRLALLTGTATKSTPDAPEDPDENIASSSTWSW